MKEGNGRRIILAFLALASLLPAAAQQPTEPDLKVAFIADSGDGSGFEKVLRLIRGEDVDLILHQGDFSYSSGPTSKWISKINEYVRGIPYLGSVGNHDSWESYYSGFFAGQIATLQNQGAQVSGDPRSGNYAVVYKGLKIVFLGDEQDSVLIGGKLLSPAQYIDSEFANDNHAWRVCSWHKNQTAMQVGSKEDGTGWDVYEACRRHGAIIATGHEHSYQRTRTLTNMQQQDIDESCKDEPETPNADACVGPGRTFAFVSGLGGTSIRDQDRCLPPSYPYGCGAVWANIYTSDQSAEYGALFITFTARNDGRMAEGYFKNVEGRVVDRFNITRSGLRPAQSAR